jgi:hypothetical protein
MKMLHFLAVIDRLKGRSDETIIPSGCKYTNISQTLLGSQQVANSIGGAQMTQALNAATALTSKNPLV